MSDRRHQDFSRPAMPEPRHRRATSSLSFSPSPARAIAASRGFFFSSEVQCLDVVSTESRSPAHRGSHAARAASTTPLSSVRSSTLPCAIAADAASTAPFRWRSTLPRSITYTRCRMEARTLLATWSPPVPRVIASRGTSCLTSFSGDIRGPARTSFDTRAPCIGR